MAIAILTITFILLLVFFIRSGLRLAWVYSSIIFGAYAYIITEVLSISSALTFRNVFISWCLLCLVLFYLLRHRGVNLAKNWSPIKGIFGFNPLTIHPLSRPFLLWFSLICILAFTFVTAIKSPPNTFDSMAYHLPKVEHWIQNRNINFYPTNEERQLYTSPFAEILILQVRLLADADTFVNIIQWFAMVSSLICVSLLIKEFGLGNYWQLTASVVTATIPMGILQSTSTQNDYVVSFWIICSALLIIRSLRIKRSSWADIAFLGLSLGLAVLTKQTSFFFLLPFVLLYGITQIVKSKNVYQLAVIFLIIILFNVSQYTRNYLLFRNPLGPESDMYKVSSPLPIYLISNTLKNISVQAGTTNTKLNDVIYGGLINIHKALNVDINDSHTSWEGSSIFQVAPAGRSENYAGNPIHLYLIFVATILILISNKLKSIPKIYAGASFLGFLIICMYLLYNPWISRLQLPFFILMSPVVALALSKFGKFFSFVIIILLIYTSIPYIMQNPDRSLIRPNSIFQKNRDEITFLNYSPKAPGIYNQMVKYIVDHNYRQIGLCATGNIWEYPFWYKLRRSYKNGSFRFEHVNVTNTSKQIPQDFHPQAVISIGCKDINSLSPKSRIEFYTNFEVDEI